MKLLHVSFLLAIFPPSTFQRSEKKAKKKKETHKRPESIKHFFSFLRLGQNDDNFIKMDGKMISVIRWENLIFFFPFRFFFVLF